MEKEDKLNGVIDLELNISSDHSRGVALLAKNEIDFLVTGANVGAKIYNQGIDLKMLNINTWGIDYLLTRGFKAESWEDLKGKSVGVLLKGGPLDFLVRYLLQENGISLDEVNLVYRPLPGAAKYFLAGNLDAVVLPEPLVTVTSAKSDNIHISLDIQKEWEKIHGDRRIPFVGLFVSGKFESKNKAVTEIINEVYRQGIEWVNENPGEAAELASKYFSMPAEVIEKSFSRINLNIYAKSESRKLTDRYFQKILQMYPDMIGGRMPNEEFYY
ncbi:NitT/TauT family transport system substrate-binding protein [Halanaerobium sp. DL-01]|jgi:NitT/TauT family transport system substrate-binding protein|uniref:ABC transporter substrate-binding protein n=2 Tax=unclassified Halanaerobium TaxID=2641197 RepID=UPI000E16F142